MRIRTALLLAVTIVVLDLTVAVGYAAQTTSSSTAADSVYLVSHGWHVGLVLRGEDAGALTQLVGHELGGFRSFELGWGDGDFYPGRGTTRLAFRAAFHSRWSVIQVVGFEGDVTAVFPRSKILRVDLSPDGLAALVCYVVATFVTDAGGRPIVVAPAQYGYGFFYLARGRYRLLDNSNTWAAKALHAAGCPIDVEAAVTAGNVLHQAVRFSRVLRPGVLLHGQDAPPFRCG